MPGACSSQPHRTPPVSACSLNAQRTGPGRSHLTTWVRSTQASEPNPDRGWKMTPRSQTHPVP